LQIFIDEKKKHLHTIVDFLKAYVT